MIPTLYNNQNGQIDKIYTSFQFKDHTEMIPYLSYAVFWEWLIKNQLFIWVYFDVVIDSYPKWFIFCLFINQQCYHVPFWWNYGKASELSKYITIFFQHQIPSNISRILRPLEELCLHINGSINNRFRDLPIKLAH